MALWVAAMPVIAAAQSVRSVSIPAGHHRSLHDAGDAHVAAFKLDRDPVTRGEFLEFIRAHPEWRRSRVEPRLADPRIYLAGWAGDLDAGTAADRSRPVTGVSWYAARAFCAAAGKRLPSTAEWEHAASAGATTPDATGDPAFIQQLVSLYATRSVPPTAVQSGQVNAYGVRGLHDLVWEWVADPNDRVAALAHADHARGQSGPSHDLTCAGAAVGAADPRNYPAFLRAAIRSGLTAPTTMHTLGFRCAQ